MRVSVFGTGYVGLVTGTCLAEVGHDVTCVDVDADRIDRLNRGIVPIHEPGLEELVKANLQSGRLHFSTSAEAAIASARVVLIAVGTPAAENGSADLSQVLEVARTIGRHLSQPALIVNKSTVPVGTAARVRAQIEAELRERGVAIDFEVISNPEFLKEGAAIHDCMRPDRIIIGSRDPAAIETMKRLYAPFNRSHERVIVMDERSAELTKYAANAMLATRISLMNELANLAECVGADIEAVRQGIGSDPRIGWQFIYPGAGYGGSCFPKDVRALAHSARQHGVRACILEAVDAVNNRQKHRLYELIEEHFEGQLAGRTFAVWGLAFKPNTDDLREASSLILLERLLQAGARVHAHDPEALAPARELFGEPAGLRYCMQPLDALEGADALILVTEWKTYWNPDPGLLKERLAARVVFDGRNVLDPVELEQAGIAYYGIGRGRSIRGGRHASP